MLVRAPWPHAAGHRSRTENMWIRGRPWRYETSTTASADLPTLAARSTGFIGCPFVRGALLVSRTTALAGNFPLLFH